MRFLGSSGDRSVAKRRTMQQRMPEERMTVSAVVAERLKAEGDRLASVFG